MERRAWRGMPLREGWEGTSRREEGLVEVVVGAAVAVSRGPEVWRAWSYEGGGEEGMVGGWPVLVLLRGFQYCCGCCG
jgi:hypothetical protein